MMRTPILHPELLAGLARLGHGSQLLIADAMYPHATGVRPGTPVVNLNLTEGMVPASLVVKLIGEAVHLEHATFMFDPHADEGESSAVLDYKAILAEHRHWGGRHIEWAGLDRHDFYAACHAPSVGLLVTTGETRPYANLLLTIGVP